MTGFGRGTARAGEAEATVEVRTVNGRNAEAKVRGLGEMPEHEATVAARVKDAIGRGNATVHVTIGQAGGAGAFRVDAEAAAAAGDTLREAAEAAGLGAGAVTLADVLRQPDVLVPAPAATDDAWPAVQAALGDALDALRTMRQTEGAALAADLAARADAIDRLREAVERRAPERIAEARERLEGRLADLLDGTDARLDPARLEAEVALLADKLDVTEETVRLESHLDQFRAALEAEGPVGRRLNFLAQELGREVNTIGSKANDAETTRLAVSMKEEVEKIREQVQNVV